MVNRHHDQYRVKHLIFALKVSKNSGDVVLIDFEYSSKKYAKKDKLACFFFISRRMFSRYHIKKLGLVIFNIDKTENKQS